MSDLRDELPRLLVQHWVGLQHRVPEALDHAQPHLLGKVLVLDALGERAQREGHAGEALRDLAEHRPRGLELRVQGQKGV